MMKGLKIVCEGSYSIRAQYLADFPAQIHDVTDAAIPGITKEQIPRNIIIMLFII